MRPLGAGLGMAPWVIEGGADVGMLEEVGVLNGEPLEAFVLAPLFELAPLLTVLGVELKAVETDGVTVVTVAWGTVVVAPLAKGSCGVPRTCELLGVLWTFRVGSAATGAGAGVGIWA